MASENNPAQFISASELALPLTAMLVLAGMVAPIGATILDVMLSLSLALSIVVLVGMLGFLSMIWGCEQN